ncbi:MAG: hypothetical protein E4G95_09740 [Bacteroidia bacterium]|nr:MAG: hypothetical protein E4G95_09740 [Bacteroidia bacterium]
MKTSLIKKIEPVLVILISIVGFFTIKELLPTALYFIMATLVGLYFFPVRIFMNGEKTMEDNQTKIGFLITSITISLLVFLSIVVLYLPGSGFFRTILILVSFINIGQFFYYLWHKRTYAIAVLHFCTACVSSVALYV